MAREIRRVRLEPDTDLLHIVEEVHADKVPRLIEREGEALALVVAPEDYRGAGAVPAPTAEGTARALKAAGAWKGLDTEEPRSKRRKRHLLSLAGSWSDLDADRMIEELYEARHQAPPSPPVDL